MGSQIQFFLGPRDLVDLGDVLSQIDDLVYLLPDLTETPIHQGVSIVPYYGAENLRLYIGRKCDAHDAVSHDLTGLSREGLLPAVYFPLIEFDRPFVSRNFIRAGRIYRVDSYWLPNGDKARKADDWISWAKEIFSLVRKCLSKIDDTGYFAGEEAIAMRSRGVLFQQIDDPRNQFCR